MKTALSFFVSSIKKYPKEFIICIVFVLVLSCVETIAPFALKYFLDRLTSSFDFIAIIIFVLALVAYIFLLTGTKILWYRSLDNFAGKYISDTLIECEKNIAENVDFYDLEKEKNSKLKHILFVDLLNTFTTIGHHLPSIFGSILIVLALLIWSSTINWAMTLILLASFVIGIFISYISKNFIYKSSKKTNVALKNINASTNEFLDCVETVKTNQIFDYFEDKTKGLVKDFIRVAKIEDSKTYFWSGISNGYNTLIMYLVSILLVLPFFNGSLANLALYSIVCSMVLGESQNIESNIRLVIKSEVCFKNIDSYLNLNIKNKESITKINEIEFKNFGINFEGKQILNDINLFIEAGSIIRLNGENGSGKTTLIRCLMGVYSNYQGFIKINGKDGSFDIRDRTLYISQNEILLNDTVKRYLELITKQNFTDNKLDSIKKEFGIDDDFLNKEIINCGENLSNGEKKKIQLIRLKMMKDNVDLLLLDEISAGLDQITKEKYYQMISSLKENNKIVILIEHDKDISIPFDGSIDL